MRRLLHDVAQFAGGDINLCQVAMSLPAAVLGAIDGFAVGDNLDSGNWAAPGGALDVSLVMRDRSGDFDRIQSWLKWTPSCRQQPRSSGTSQREIISPGPFCKRQAGSGVHAPARWIF